MCDIIYVPQSGDTEALKKQRQRLVLGFLKLGWTLQGTIELRDNLGTPVQVQVLTRS